MDTNLPFILLGIPGNLLTNLGHRDLNEFSAKIKDNYLPQLFLKALSYALNQCRETTYHQHMESILARRQGELLYLFITRQQDYNHLLATIQTGTLATEVAGEMVAFFDFQDDNRLPLAKMLTQCMNVYRANFLNAAKAKAEEDLIKLLAAADRNVLMQAVSTFEPKIAQQYRDIINKLGASQGVTTILQKQTGQIRLLAVTPAPGNDKHYELEQHVLLESVKNIPHQDLYKDFPDPVKGTLETVKQHLAAGKHDILYLACHGGITRENKPVLRLEKSDGTAQLYYPRQLAEALKPIPRIVILTACQSADQRPFLQPAAEELFEAGIGTVIAMKGALDYRAAAYFNMGFFGAFLKGGTIKEAFNQACVPLAKFKQQAFPQLFTREENLKANMLPTATVKHPQWPGQCKPGKAPLVDPGFMGRRQTLRHIFSHIKQKEGVIVLQGPGGIGKSTLAARTAAALREQGYTIIPLQGPQNLETLLETVNIYYANLPRKREFEYDAVYSSKETPSGKFDKFVKDYFSREKVALIYDDYDPQQPLFMPGSANSKIVSPTPGETAPAADLLNTLKEAFKGLDTLALICTTRPQPGFITVNPGAVSNIEARKIQYNAPGLKRLDKETIAALFQMGLQVPVLANVVANRERGTQPITRERALQLFPWLLDNREGERTEIGTCIQHQVETLLKTLTPNQRRILEHLSVYESPQSEEELKAQNMLLLEEDREALEGLVLIEDTADESGKYYYLHSRVAAVIERHANTANTVNTNNAVKPGETPADRLAAYHRKAAETLEKKAEQDLSPFINIFLAHHRHLIRARMWDEAATLTAAYYHYLVNWGFSSLAFDLIRHYREEEQGRASEAARSLLYSAFSHLYKETSQLPKALAYADKALAMAKRNNLTDEIPLLIKELGDVRQAQGLHEQAVTIYKEAKKMASQNNDGTELINSNFAMGKSLEALGKNFKALGCYEDALMIAGEIEDQQEVGPLSYRIGYLYYIELQQKDAFEHITKARQIAEESGDERLAARSLFMLGAISEARKQVDEAAKLYRQALESAEKKNYSLEITRSLVALGNIALKRNKWEEAAAFFKRVESIVPETTEPNGRGVLIEQLFRMGARDFYREKYNDAMLKYVRAYSLYREQPAGIIEEDEMKERVKTIREWVLETRFQGALLEFRVLPDEIGKPSRLLRMTLKSLRTDTMEIVIAKGTNKKREKVLKKLSKEIFAQQKSQAANSPAMVQYYRMLEAWLKNEEYNQYLEKMPENYKQIFQQETKTAN